MWLAVLVQDALGNGQADAQADGLDGQALNNLPQPAMKGKPLTVNQLKRVEKAIVEIEKVHTKSVELRVLTGAEEVAQFISPNLKTKDPQPVKGV